MNNLHVAYSGKMLDFDMAREMALIRARGEAMRQPAILSWHQLSTHTFSPGFDGADEATWWKKYGVANGGCLNVSVGDDFEFILAETGGFETLHQIPIRNLTDAAGNEFICQTGMLDDTGRPRRDACLPLEEWMADQY
jgi:hypothetical protein